jgi:predicted RND superfamily exporter protein
MLCWAVSSDSIACMEYLAILTWLIVVQVIMIHRLHVLYRRSRRILISLTVTVLVITIACGVVTAKANNYITGGKLYLWTKDSGAPDSSDKC